ncbi:hypothetical protein ACHAPB_008705 [Verticillium nonalfalfae]
MTRERRKMPTRDVERYNKAVRWNIGSLLTKCEHYSNLRGIELALYVSFPEDGGFVSYDSANLSWRQDIEAKKAHTPPTLLLYIAERDLSRYLSLKQIFLGIRPLNNITWLDLITTVVFVSANAVAISYGVQDIAGFIRRSDVLSVVNMAPLLLGTRMNPIASGCGLSLPTYVAMHRWLGIMAILQGLTHAAVSFDPRIKRLREAE